MRGKKAKALRRAIYGEQSPRLRQYVRGAVTGQIRRRDLGGAYRMAKRSPTLPLPPARGRGREGGRGDL